MKLHGLGALLVCVAVVSIPQCLGANSSVCLGQVSYTLELKCSDPLVIAIVDIAFGVHDRATCSEVCCVVRPQCLEAGDNAALADFGCAGGSACKVQSSQIPSKELRSCNNATASFLHVSYECVIAPSSSTASKPSTVAILSSAGISVAINSVPPSTGGATAPGSSADASDLSTGAKIGIGVAGCCLLIIIIVLLTILLLRRRRLRRGPVEDDDHGFVDDSSRWDETQTRIQSRNNSLLKHKAANKKPSRSSREAGKKTGDASGTRSNSGGSGGVKNTATGGSKPAVDRAAGGRPAVPAAEGDKASSSRAARVPVDGKRGSALPGSGDNPKTNAPPEKPVQQPQQQRPQHHDAAATRAAASGEFAATKASSGSAEQVRPAGGGGHDISKRGASEGSREEKRARTSAAPISQVKSAETASTTAARQGTPSATASSSTESGSGGGGKSSNANAEAQTANRARSSVGQRPTDVSKKSGNADSRSGNSVVGTAAMADATASAGDVAKSPRPPAPGDDAASSSGVPQRPLPRPRVSSRPPSMETQVD